MSSSVSAVDEAPPAFTPSGDETSRQSNGIATVVRKWLHEPLVHFLLIGFALFAAYSLFTPSTALPSSSRIELTQEDLNQLQVTWMAQWKRLPTPDEMRGLVENRVQQEILYREALAMGLEQNDEIIKRRLAQKMEFLAEDISSIREPQKEELKAWFGNNSARFAMPGRITFRHLYFSPDKRGQQAQHDAAKILQTLSSKPIEPAKVSDLGDRFVDQDYFADCLPEQISKVFGSAFAESLFKLKSSERWQGPVESGLGWHLVLIETVTPGRVPSFDEADPEQVKSEWTTAMREEAKRKAFAELKQRYEIVLPK
jgi:peptidyl-prolyl cis-trans isomerase C